MIKIDKALIESVGEQALQSPRRRLNHNFHRELSDPLQRLLNIIEPLSYIRPHKHENPDKVEAFVLLRGRLLITEFHPDGRIAEACIADPANGLFGVEIPPRTFHMIIALEPLTVVYEVKNGPYDPIDVKNFAPWAPKEGSPEAEFYLRKIIELTNAL